MFKQGVCEESSVEVTVLLVSERLPHSELDAKCCSSAVSCLA
jgi:hypothetical protein